LETALDFLPAETAQISPDGFEISVRHLHKIEPRDVRQNHTAIRLSLMFAGALGLEAE
jgi:hypothetical protein